MEEVVTRRVKHSIENPKGAFGTLPDVIFADGGLRTSKGYQESAEKI